MKITEINGNVISIGKTSITVKRDDGKTCGIVKNCIPFQTMTARDKFALKHLGLEASKNCVICDGEIYYLNNKRLENWINQQAHPEFFTTEKAKAEQQKVIADAVRQQGITVIDCIING